MQYEIFWPSKMSILLFECQYGSFMNIFINFGIKKKIKEYSTLDLVVRIQKTQKTKNEIFIFSVEINEIAEVSSGNEGIEYLY